MGFVSLMFLGSDNLSLVHQHITNHHATHLRAPLSHPPLFNSTVVISFSLPTTTTSSTVVETGEVAMVFSDAASLLATLITAALEVKMYSAVIFVLAHSKKFLICSEVEPASATAVAADRL